MADDETGPQLGPAARTVAALLFVAGLTFSLVYPAFQYEDRTNFFEICHGLDCPDHGAIDVDVVLCVETNCLTTKYATPFLEIEDLSGPPELRCGPGNCGASTDALLFEGWRAGRLKITAPPFQGYAPPDPLILELREGEIQPLVLRYQRP